MSFDYLTSKLKDMETLVKIEISRIIRKESKPSPKKNSFDEAIIGLGVGNKIKK